eukprot:3939235-Rhodomonas_salina.1
MSADLPCSASKCFAYPGTGTKVVKMIKIGIQLLIITARFLYCYYPGACARTKRYCLRQNETEYTCILVVVPHSSLPVMAVMHVCSNDTVFDALGSQKWSGVVLYPGTPGT